MTKRENDFDSVYDLVEHAIDYAFEKGRFQLRFYDFLKYRKTTKAEVDAFISSSTAAELSDLVLQLEEYIKGGNDSDHRQLREAYPHIPNPQARKIRNYLTCILDDAFQYSNDKRRGRKRRSK